MIPIAAILARIAEGVSVRELATEYRLALPLARALWEAEVLGARDPLPECAACAGSGAKDGVPCGACRGCGMGASA